MKIFIITLALIALYSCGGASKSKMSDNAKEMRELESKKGHGCDVVAKVTGVNKNDSVDLARNHAKNLAAKEGANAIFFDEEVSNAGSWKVNATGYDCN